MITGWFIYLYKWLFVWFIYINKWFLGDSFTFVNDSLILICIIYEYIINNSLTLLKNSSCYSHTINDSSSDSFISENNLNCDSVIHL